MTRSDALVSGNLVDTISRAAESLPPLHCFGRDRKAASSYNAPSQPARAKGVALAGRRATPSSSANVPVERAFLRGGAREQPTLPSTRAFSSLDLGRPSGTRPSGARDQGSRGTLSGGGGRAALTPPRVAAGRPTRSQTAAAQTAVCPPASPPSATAALRSGSSRAGSASASEAAPSSAPVCLKCDACDGKHATDRCPWFKGKARDKHPDAKRASEKKMLGMQSGPVEVLRHGSARVVRQPGDGSCLFHSLSHGLRDGSSASSLRREVASFISENPGLMISDSPLKDWVLWDSNSTVSQYCRRMATGGVWGGGIEMAVVSHLKRVNVFVYQQSGGGFKRISSFESPSAGGGKPRAVRVLYGGGVHYDALEAEAY